MSKSVSIWNGEAHVLHPTLKVKLFSTLNHLALSSCQFKMLNNRVFISSFGQLSAENNIKFSNLCLCEAFAK